MYCLIYYKGRYLYISQENKWQYIVVETMLRNTIFNKTRHLDAPENDALIKLLLSVETTRIIFTIQLFFILKLPKKKY